MDKLNRRNREGLDFEISFYEDLIKDKPDFIDVLILLGDTYTKRGFYQKGLSIDKRLARLMPDDPVVTYNLACSYSLVGDIDASLKALKNAIKKGYFDLGFIKKDPDLENVRKDKRFKELITELEKEMGGGINGIWFVKEKKGEKVEEEKDSCQKKIYKKTKAAKEKAGKKKNKSCRYSKR